MVDSLQYGIGVGRPVRVLWRVMASEEQLCFVELIKRGVMRNLPYNFRYLAEIKPPIMFSHENTPSKRMLLPPEQ